MENIREHLSWGEKNAFSLILFMYYAHIVRRHIVGGANRTLISVETPLQLCRIGTCRRLSAGCPQIVVALFEKQQPVLLLK